MVDMNTLKYRVSSKSHSKFVTQLLKETLFNKQEIETLLALYDDIIRNSPTKTLNRSKFREFQHNSFDITDDMLLDRIYQTFLHNEPTITAGDWVIGMSILLKGTLEQQINFCFRIYDLNSDGFISKEEMYQFLKGSLIKHSPDEDPEEGIKDLIDIVCRKCDRDGDGRVSLNDYKLSVMQDTLLLQILGQCLPDIKIREAFVSTLSQQSSVIK